MQAQRTKAELQQHKAKITDSSPTPTPNYLRTPRSVHLLLKHALTLPLSQFASTDLKTVGNYTLGKLIGKGSFGKVYLARHNLTNGSKVGFAIGRGQDK
ncbi:hypothetical protein CLCR_00997 [Cladophialophora carrionii]|uniref:Protein kinase domain-containing protein n=1 Tax=Cladophialophora carrionii TaxID=86049 RepID=A0A1C1D0T8_9EURO|nr:hypothetical protein CLCR_00997 [Cladophialophora carrionii]